jgi:hypothetical protein
MSRIYVIDGKIVKEENLHKIRYAYDPIKVYDLVDEIYDKDFLDNFRSQRQRDEHLRVLLGGDEYKDLINFKRLFNEHIRSDEEMKASNPSWHAEGSTKHTILKAFTEIGYDNKKFARLLKSNKEYLLLRITNDVEYFQAYLKFNNCKLSFKTTKKFWVPSSMYSIGGKWEYKLVDKFTLDSETMEKFQTAKNNIKNEKRG